MGKEKSPPKFGPKQAGATAKYLRVPPRKARFVLDAVRGKYVDDALAVLKFVPNFAARAIEDVIQSAAANAENSRPNSEETGKPLPPLVRENLKLVRCFVDEGPRIKRLQPRAQGRAYRIVKRMCHITVIVEETAPRPRPVRKPAAGRRAQTAGRVAAVKTVEQAKAVTPEVTTAPVEETTPIVEETVQAENTVANHTSDDTSADAPKAE